VFLFQQETIENLLPYDGVATYYPAVLDRVEAENYFDRLLASIEWKNDEAVVMGRSIVTKRKVAWYGDLNYSYTYSGATKQALPWTAELIELKQLAEEITAAKFNSCLLNLYHDGYEGVGWHSDNEASLVKNAMIASYSLGAERIFRFKHKKTKQNVEIILENTSLLAMSGATQDCWLHSLPKSALVTGPRINLTFRLMVEQ
jgi:alkylated DNA repair dioxygenase AlkB